MATIEEKLTNAKSVLRRMEADDEKLHADIRKTLQKHLGESGAGSTEHNRDCAKFDGIHATLQVLVTNSYSLKTAHDKHQADLQQQLTTSRESMYARQTEATEQRATLQLEHHAIITAQRVTNGKLEAQIKVLENQRKMLRSEIETIQKEADLAHVSWQQKYDVLSNLKVQEIIK